MSFDYIIIGGGTAGLVLSVRLTENPLVTVCVLETGSNCISDPLILTPGLSNAMIDNPDYDWMFVTAPQANAHGRTFAWPRGKVLGGTSAINGAMLSHPSRQDLDSWERLGNKGWNFENLANYYRKFETYIPPSTEGGEYLNSGYVDPQLHGTEGPIRVLLSEVQDTVKDVWTETCLGAGLSHRKDPRTGVTLGGFNQTVAIDPKTKTRSYAGNAYFAANAYLSNLYIITDAMVQKINFGTRQEDGLVAAESVTYTLSGKEYTMIAKKEVILCARTIQSPQILELSGIGSDGLLRKYGITPVVENQNVGENLQDHVIAPVAWEVKEGVRTLDELREPEKLQQVIEEYRTNKTGPLADKLTCVAFVSGQQFLEPLANNGIEELIKNLCKSTPDPPRSHGTAKQLEILKKYLFLHRRGIRRRRLHESCQRVRNIQPRLTRRFHHNSQWTLIPLLQRQHPHPIRLHLRPSIHQSQLPLPPTRSPPSRCWGSLRPETS